MNFKNKTDDNLLNELKSLVKEEKKLLKEILDYLEEVEARNLYLKEAYSSMFAFCTGYLGYTEQEAQTRILAMRLSRIVPEVKDQIRSGEVSLSVAAKVQAHIAKENKIRKVQMEPPVGSVLTKELVESVKNLSFRSSQIKLLEIFPHHAEIKDETARVVSAKTVRVEMNLSSETFEALKRLQNLRSHAHRDKDYQHIIKDLCKLGLYKWDLTIPRKTKSAKKAELH